MDLSNVPTDQLVLMLQQHAQAQQPSPMPAANPATDFGGDTLQVGPLDTGIPISQNWQNALAGAGKAYGDIYRGARQLLPGGASEQPAIDEAKKLDAPLMATKAGLAGNIAGNMAIQFPLMLAPGVNTYAGAALSGLGTGALQPVSSDEGQNMRYGNMGLSALAGVAGQGMGRLLGGAIRPVQSNLGPEEQRLADIATREGIPLRLSQVTGSKPLAVTESMLEQLPFSSGPQIAQREAQQAAFNQAVLAKAGISANTATAPVLAARKSALGATFNQLSKGATLDFNQGLGDQIANIVGEAQQHLPPDKASALASVADKIFSQVGPDGRMLGTNYQGWREPLRLMAKSGNEYSHYAGLIRGALDDAFKQQLPSDLAQQWGEASGQYGALKQIMQAMGGAGAGTKLGNISPAQLEGALTSTVGKEGKALGRGSLNDLVAAGRQFVSPNVPDSGTAIRGYITKALTGAALPSAVGAGAGYYYGGIPGAATGGMLGLGADLVGSAAMPFLAQKALSSPAAARYLTKGIVPITEAHRALLANILRAPALAGAAALEAGQ